MPLLFLKVGRSAMSDSGVIQSPGRSISRGGAVPKRTKNRWVHGPSLRSSLALPARSAGRVCWRYGAILLFFLTWQLLSQFEIVDPSVIPPVTKVAAAMVDGFTNGGLLSNMLVSLRRSGIAFGLSAALAIPLGLFMGTFQRFEGFADGLLQLFRQTSALAIYPIFILLLGLGETSKVMIIAWAAFFPVLLNTIAGVKGVDVRLIEMVRIFGASKTEIFRRVILPSATPAIFVGLRLSATTSLLLLVAAEMIGAKKGLGFLVINAQYNFQIPLMFAAILLLAIIGLTVNYVLVLSQKFLCRWENPRQTKAAINRRHSTSSRPSREAAPHATAGGNT
jgi:sulfonate transport system permease protein